MPLIPFRLTPGSIGLKGRPYEEARAYYELEGEPLARRLAEIAHKYDGTDLRAAMLAIDLRYGKITQFEHDLALARDEQERLAVKVNHGKITQYEYDLKMAKDDAEKLAVELRHGKISQYDYDLKQARDEKERLAVQLRHARISAYSHDRAVAEMEWPEGVERDAALLDVDLLHGKVSKTEYEKRAATLRDEPWIGIINQDFDIEKGVEGLRFEFDWNHQWIEYLRLNGYKGNSDEAVVEQWFNHLCRSVAEEQAKEEIAALERNAPPGRVINRVLGIGGTEFS